MAIALYTNSKKKRRLSAAHRAYRAALASLKQSPQSADMREKALSLGREYSNLTRNKKGITVYDEVALMNDINAACAGVGSAAATTDGAKSQTVEVRLQVLKELRAKDLIDEIEYAKRRAEILQSI